MSGLENAVGTGPLSSLERGIRLHVLGSDVYRTPNFTSGTEAMVMVMVLGVC